MHHLIFCTSAHDSDVDAAAACTISGHTPVLPTVPVPDSGQDTT